MIRTQQESKDGIGNIIQEIDILSNETDKRRNRLMKKLRKLIAYMKLEHKRIQLRPH